LTERVQHVATGRIAAEPTAHRPGEGFLDLRVLSRMLWRRRFAALTLFLLANLGAALATLLSTPLFEASSTLLIKFGRESVYRPESGGERGVVVTRNREAMINSEIQILRSSDVVRAVVDEMGVEKLYPGLLREPSQGTPLEWIAVARVLASLRAAAVPETDVIEVGFKHPDPDVAAQAVNLIVERFKEKHLEAFAEPEATKFLEEKAESARGHLEQAEQQLKAFQVEHPEFSLEQRDELVIRERAQLIAEVGDVENQIASAQQQGMREDPIVGRAKTQLLDLQLQEQKLLNTHSDQSRQVANVRREIARVQEFLAKQQAATDSQQLGTLGLLKQRKAQLEQRIAALDERLRAMPELAYQYRNLTREVDSRQDTYQRYLKRLEDARTSEEMDRQKIANIRVIQKAQIPLAPVSPNPMLNLAVGVVLGLALAAGGVLLLEQIAPSGR
jgi:uncharacterized protein involved in exopolysaccharide biosynthesis